MAKEINENTLLEYWTPPEAIEQDALQVTPVSFITTTYTFNPEFFEDECLTRFLNMETERENDGVAYLIEKEEKLAGLRCGIVVVDQNNCKGERSLRWDLAPARVSQGVMHAKITVLQWTNCIRILISSANLTEMGYCINQEVFGVVDYVKDGDTDLRIINNVFDFLNQLTSNHCGEVIASRVRGQMAEIKTVLRAWNITESNYKKDDVSLHTIFVTPTGIDLFSQMKDIWNSHTSSPPSDAYITSPFFDAEMCDHSPSFRIYSILRQRGAASTEYNVTTEPISEGSKELLVNAPEFLKQVPNANAHSVSFSQLLESGTNENGKMVPRPVHLKSIWLKNDDFHQYLIGSSNFTSSGTGLGRRKNYEANLVYSVSETANRKAYSTLEEAYPNNALALDDKNLKFRYRVNEDESTTENEYLNLPLGFGEAVLKKIGEYYYLELNFVPEKIPSDFKVYVGSIESKTSVLALKYDFNSWYRDGKKSAVLLDCDEKGIPAYLLTNWEKSEGYAFWPIIIENQVTLPAVEELKNLPLNALLQILSSSQPLHRLLGLINKIRARSIKIDSENQLDALKMVDTSGFLLQRTKKVSYAMRSLRERLEKPVFTMESLYWRLNGPIGVLAMKHAICNEVKNNEEKQFLLAELALELSRVKPMAHQGCLKATVIKSAIRTIIKELFELGEFSNTQELSAISNYSNLAINKALNEL